MWATTISKRRPHLQRLLSIVVLIAQFSKASSSSSSGRRVTRASKPKFNGVTLRASEIAACVGRNKYKSPDGMTLIQNPITLRFLISTLSFSLTHFTEVFDDLWKRHSPETFLGQTRQEKQQIALDNSPSIVKSVVYASMKYKSQDSQDAQSQAAKTEAIIAANPNMSEADKAAVTEMMRSRVSMSFGTRAESKTATKVEIEENIVLIADSKTYKYDLCQVENTQFIISGKVDRVEEVGGELYLVEIKNRMNRLFLEVPGAVPFPFICHCFISTFTLIPLLSPSSLYFYPLIPLLSPRSR